MTRSIHYYSNGCGGRGLKPATGDWPFVRGLENSPPRDRSGNPVFDHFRRRKSFVSDAEFLKIGLSGSISRFGGVPRAINSSLESSGGVVDQRREATL